jgi:hypothetical protein
VYGVDRTMTMVVSVVIVVGGGGIKIDWWWGWVVGSYTSLWGTSTDGWSYYGGGWGWGWGCFRVGMAGVVVVL